MKARKEIPPAVSHSIREDQSMDTSVLRIEYAMIASGIMFTIVSIILFV
jgi:hypothetical protein